MANFSRPLTIPAPDAPFDVLAAHFMAVSAGMAMMRYDDAIHSCSVCLRLGENKLGKKDSISGRARYCSEECEALWRRYDLVARTLVAKEPNDG